MNKIKIGRKEYDINDGDYIMDNGACLQFIAGDGRCLRIDNWSFYSNIRFPKSKIKELPKHMQEKLKTRPEKGFIRRIYFKEQNK